MREVAGMGLELIWRFWMTFPEFGAAGYAADWLIR